MTMAYQVEEAGTRLSRTTIERRSLGARDMRLDLKFCGICQFDLVVASDKLGGGIFPMVPGHEMVGTVSEVGENVQGVSIGDTRSRWGALPTAVEAVIPVTPAISTIVKLVLR